VAALLAVAAGLVLAGVSWTVQVVVYPAFRRVPAAAWPAYHAAHSAAMVCLLALPWAAQGVATTWLLATRPGEALVWVHAVLTALPVMLTVAGAVPLHSRLAGNPDQALLRRLARVHALRTAAWTGAAGVALLLLAT